MNEIELSPFETEVVTMLLNGDDKVLSILREQFRNFSVFERIETGEGFYINFKIPMHMPRTNESVPSCKPNFNFGDVVADIFGLKSGAGFLIWVRDGYLNQLEGYTYNEKWPNELKDYRLHYMDEERDIASLQKEWLVNN
jgi:hypothetical protein